MDLYTFSLVLGATGLGAMGVAGIARQTGADGAHGTHAHGGDGVHGAHGAHGADGAAAHGSHATHLQTTHFQNAHVHDAHGVPSPHTVPHALSSHSADVHAAHGPAHGPHTPHALAWLMSPRVLFGILLGFGTAGVVLKPALGGFLLFAAALACGLAFERLLLETLHNFTLRFASRPALTLETAVAGEGTAVTTFDDSGHGIVQLEIDGQVVQVLGTLAPNERALGHRVRAGETLRVEEVDPTRNRCRVSLL